MIRALRLLSWIAFGAALAGVLLPDPVGNAASATAVVVVAAGLLLIVVVGSVLALVTR